MGRGTPSPTCTTPELAGVDPSAPRASSVSASRERGAEDGGGECDRGRGGEGGAEPGPGQCVGAGASGGDSDGRERRGAERRADLGRGSGQTGGEARVG